MKLNTLKIIFFILLIVIMVFGICFSSFESYGRDPDAAVESKKEKDKKLFNPDEYYTNVDPTEPKGAEGVKSIANIIISALQIIGSILSVLVLAVLGVKYLVGSVEQKAEYKKTMGPYLIGAVMVFGITNLLGIFSSIISGMFN